MSALGQKQTLISTAVVYALCQSRHSGYFDPVEVLLDDEREC
jgi:hypothetical protein